MSTAVLTAVAWAYKNGARHIGHKAGSGVASGVFARCHRMAGNRVLMVSGMSPAWLFIGAPRCCDDRPRTVFA
jgi:methionyl-tRNA synthetase